MALRFSPLLWKNHLQQLHKHITVFNKLCVSESLHYNHVKTHHVRNFQTFIRKLEHDKTLKLFTDKHVTTQIFCVNRQQNIFLLGSTRWLSSVPRKNKPKIVLHDAPNFGGQVPPQDRNEKLTALFYSVAFVLFMGGVSYAAVPLYRVFCQSTGRGGQSTIGGTVDKVETMEIVKDRIIKVRFNADIDSNLRWNFRPQQGEIQVRPGETALAFYTAKNPTKKPIIGISTYTVVPFEAGYYFNKIQCFCFEEQRLNPDEQVDMPVFFYIDPDFMEDPRMENVDSIVLSYTFFEAKDGLNLPYPGFAPPQQQRA